MTAKHTPGPWNCNRASAGGYNIVVSEIAPIDICVVSKTNKSPAEIDANARLIAAAPETAAERDELLRVLQFVATDPCFKVLGSVTQEEVHAAIAKATGGES